MVLLLFFLTFIKIKKARENFNIYIYMDIIINSSK